MTSIKFRRISIYLLVINKIRSFFNIIYVIIKIQFCPSFVPQALEDHFFVPRALRGTKMPIFEVKSDEIQTSANMN